MILVWQYNKAPEAPCVANLAGKKPHNSCLLHKYIPIKQKIITSQVQGGDHSSKKKKDRGHFLPESAAQNGKKIRPSHFDKKIKVTHGGWLSPLLAACLVYKNTSFFVVYKNSVSEGRSGHPHSDPQPNVQQMPTRTPSPATYFCPSPTPTPSPSPIVHHF